MRRERKYYYGILGLSPGASNAEVKSAYRRLVKLYHPDKDPSPDSEVMYKEIRAAYDRLLKWDSFDTTRAEPIYQPPTSGTQTTSGSHTNQEQETKWHTVETATESHYRVNRIPFELKNIPEVFAGSLRELTRDELFGVIAAFVFACVPVIGKPYAVFAAFLYIISWIVFVYFRYYFALSLPLHKRILLAVWYGIIVGFMIACLYMLTKTNYFILLFGSTLFAFLLTAGLRKE